MEGLLSVQEEWCEPWWTHYHPEIKFQSAPDGPRKKLGERKTTLLSTWDVFKREKKRRKRRRINFHFGQNCLKLCQSALDGSQDEMASCVVKISVTTRESVEKPGRGAAEWTKALASLCRKKSTCWNTGPYAISLIWLKLFMLMLLLSYFKKGRATHPVKTFCVFSVSYASSFLPQVI